MTVDRASVDAMANILNMLNGGGAAPAVSPSGIHLDDYSSMSPAGIHNDYDMSGLTGDFDPSLLEGHGTAPAPSSAVSRAVVSTPDTDAMKQILQAMYSVGNESPIATLAEKAETDMELKAALATQKTDRGARIGEWEIIVKEGKSLTTYDVVSDDGHTVIARDLYIYDAAYGIAKRLNEGVAINDRKIRDLLKLEEDYAKNRTDAAQFKERAKRLREKGEHMRADVAEDRLDEAQRQATEALDDILKLAGIRR